MRRQLEAILWLRWKLTLRAIKRGNAVGAVFAVLIGGTAVFSGIVAFSTALLVGLWLLPRAEPEHLLLAWGSVAVGFLFFSAIDVLVELQRSEPFSLTKILHLPVPLRGAFVLNYVSSFLSFSLAVFGPLMIGLALATVARRGWQNLWLFPLMLTFVLMVTALTYQFRGWLGSLMANKRQRGTIVAIATLTFVLVANAPNILRFTWSDDTKENLAQRQRESIEHTKSQAAEGSIDEDTASRELKRLEEEHEAELRELRDKRFEDGLRLTRKVSRVVPPGWLPYAAWALDGRRQLPALWATLGMASIAALSLRRAYRSTLRLYLGEVSGRRPRPRVESRTAGEPGRSLEWKIPGFSDSVSVTAIAGFRSLWRSAQVKILLLTPFLILVIGGGALFSGRHFDPPPALVALIALGFASLTMLTLSQLLQNLFGYDGGGFRSFVLSAAPRSEILLGKNLSIAPMALAIGFSGVVLLEILSPMRPSHALASLLQVVNIYLICCMLGNLISILGPMAVSPGTLKPVKAPPSALAKQFAFALLIPVALVPTAMPLGLEELLRFQSEGAVPPVYLVLSIVELALVVWIYRRVLLAEGRLLASREQRVLEVVGKDVE